MLRDVHPHVFGVQEAYDFQIQYILEQCPEYKSVGVGREDGVSKGEHMSLFYDSTRIELIEWGTYWLSETPDEPSKGWDAACKRTATWALLREIATGNRFYMVNTHLDHKGVVARREGLALIYRKIQQMNPGGVPMVLTGDFNVLPDNECLTDISKLMRNARDYADETDVNGSFNGFGVNAYTSGDPGKEYDPKVATPIDYIYYSGFRKCPRFKVVNNPYAGKKFISDHYPIYADLEL